ncbi:MAG TPA: ABC transporter permease [Candidatus Acidoferrales bacterium]|nr:ABC transporter permease [Candidatus Acidoferrales bacterium]
MIKNYLRVAFRNLLNYKAYSFINIAGLAVGIACCIAIMLFVRDELSYDEYNKFADRIYRPHLLLRANGHEMNTALSPVAMGPAIYTDLPDVAAYTRLIKSGPTVVRYENKTFVEENLFGADSTVFDVFTFPFVVGNPKTALIQPNTVVITESMAHKYFGNDNPIGKILNTGNQDKFVVTGVIKDIPQNSHLHPDFMASLTTSQDSRNPTWISNNYYTYLLLRKGVSPIEFQKKLDDEVMKYASPQLKAVAGFSLEQFRAAGNNYGLVLQPLTSIHLNSHLDYEVEPNGDITYVYIFSAIAIAILLIACINFVNLATARSEKRAKEVGVRKTLGSARSHLVGQFMSESIVISFIAVVLAIGIVELLLPFFNQVADKKMSLHLFNDPLSLPVLICFAIVVGIIAGSYPAFYLSSFHPIDVLRSEVRKGGRKSLLRSGLVICQFAISIALFAGTFIVFAQLRYVQTRNLGFDKEETIVIDRTSDLSTQLQSFEDELRTNRGIVNLTNSNAIPGNQGGDNGCRLEGAPENRVEDIQQMFCDYDFAKTYKLGIADGRFFSKEHPSDSAAVVVNEEVEKSFNAKNIVGRHLVFPGNGPGGTDLKCEIVGVVKDFNYRSLHEPIRPLAIRLFPRQAFIGRFVTVRLAPGDHLSTMSFIENVWKKYAGDEEFSCNFLNDDLQKLYAADQRTSEIAGAFSIVAIFIACLGLLGLAAFVTEQRTKEIGIRKVLGASVAEIVALLSKEFVKWVLIANVVAWPLAYYVMNNWLKNFAYRTEISLWIFVASGVVALVIALLTVSSHAMRAATANPVEALRYE